MDKWYWVKWEGTGPRHIRSYLFTSLNHNMLGGTQKNRNQPLSHLPTNFEDFNLTKRNNDGTWYVFELDV